ncbi:glycosyltransferase [Lactiplantibacillus mudanjiangensis]|uniref:Glycosyl transferase [Lactobacillus kunkeei] n=1 Tax=Lactiplantibacillus mudanjiangensis TaxID=1296538 RepID=A0A660DW50_9LACO|nr:glycosyltransferase family 2 protein [Lactiplantibacillus mudanjiangensis]VDG25234.1 glycosyl transferase [Lactobacillus kunkeei] [Lactiplantibacillus mudanjiangensis]VDG27514.1 glycosyl transferase [Lactobacillus kunkeei] [Lactiplantibacillus mudanjiangensis]VDG33089.1 glycosyl transferase [Lactobacillus kunkeei] [Lactiplantibacillus mudanjiangensis]
MWLINLMNDFVIGYPILVASLWIIGCLYFGKLQRTEKRPVLTPDTAPLVSILVPAHNEQDTLKGAVASIAALHYHNFEIILIDDKSSDDTLNIMYELQKAYENRFLIKVVPIEVNQGKANAMNQGLKVANGEYLLGIDSDSILDYQSLSELVKTLNSDPHIGAVAGKPVVRNRTTILGRLQLLEYIGVIDIIKKAQAFLTGRITTVSGVIVAFRRDALLAVGGWNPAVMTEDIDITWRMYRHGWQVRYEPRAICWILVPESVRNLIKQRQRWSRGGLEVLVGNRDVLAHGSWSKRVLLYETVISNVWAICTSLSLISWVLNLIMVHSVQLDGDILLILLVISFTQFGIGFKASQAAAYLEWRDLLLIPVYIIYYWMINLVSCIAAIISFVLDPDRIGTWTSPDRGLK